MSTTPYPRGSEWRKWDLHIHTPGTAKNDNYPNDPSWGGFLDALEEKDVPENERKNIAVFGITDYFSIENYKKAVSFQNAGRLSGKSLLPNVELRITPVTNKNTPINLHVIFDPNLDVSIIEREFFQQLQFSYDGHQYSLLNNDLITLGRAIKPDCEQDDTAARKAGIDQINIPYTEIRKVLNQSKILQGHFLVAVSNSSNDGNSGIQDSSLRATRCEIYKMADMVFSANPNDVEFFLGKNINCSADEVRRDYGSIKPCIRGSDAHKLSKINVFESNRYTWIKADPTFEGLKQIIYEPEERVRIQEFHPEGKRGYEVIDKVILSGENFVSQKILMNPNLVTIIGGRSSGKSTLLEGIARKVNPKNIEGDNNKQQYFEKICQEMKIIWQDNSSESERDIDYFRQEYMHEIARDSKKSNNLIDKILMENMDFKKAREVFSKFESNNNSELVSKCNELFNLIKQEKEDAKPLGDRNGIETEIAKIREDLEAILKNGMSLTEEEQAQFNKLDLKIKGLKEEINYIGNDISLLENMRNEDIISSPFIKKFSQLSSNKGSEIKDQINEKCSHIRNDFLNFLNEKIEVLQSLMTQNENTISQVGQSELYLKGINAFSENARYCELNERIKGEEQKLDTFIQWEKRQRQYKDNINACMQDIITLHLRYKENLIAQNFNIGEEICINVSISLQSEEISNYMSSKLNKYGNVRKSYVESFAENYKQNPKQTIEELISKVCNNNLECLSGNNPEDVLQNFIVKNWYSYSYDITYQGDTFEDMSPGKRAYIILRLLLDYSKKTCPILIDQPEDSLDNRAIYSDLVQYLMQKKKERQIILVTHNSNVVIGTDAEQIIVANQHDPKAKNSDEKKFQYISAALENTMPKNPHEEIILASQGIREHVCEILEGGAEAFSKREKKYGFDKS
ncbi:MAG: ATP-binding protein [Lentisphaerae bacterium]|nr:ATP-binding protein [Lentisphaerota bacterium]